MLPHIGAVAAFALAALAFKVAGVVGSHWWKVTKLQLLFDVMAEVFRHRVSLRALARPSVG
ncbi:MAG: hypothetical protein QE284_18630 [Rhizobium sp.]|nr:hypothetical protein [Rhizobium sp.]